MLHYSAPPVVGGVEQVMQEHSRLFSKAGHKVTIFTGRGKQNDPEIKVIKYPLFSSNNPRILAIKRSLDNGKIPDDFFVVKDEIASFLNKYFNDFDAIIAHNICTLHKNLPLTAALHEFMQQKSPPLLIAWDHDLAWKNDQYLDELFDEWPWKLLKQTWHLQKHIHVTISKMRQKEMAQVFNIPPSHIKVIPSGIDWQGLLAMNEQSLEIINTYHLMDAFPLFLLPVRITRRKNIELAIHIIAHIKESFPKAALLVSGPIGPHNPKNKLYLSELMNLTAELIHPSEITHHPYEQGVIFLANFIDTFIPIETIFSLYRFCDALLFPSFQEGFGIPILEAGMTGKPIFCSDILPFHETAGNFADFFDPHGDPDMIADRICTKITSDKTLMHKNVVRQNYTWEKIFKDQIEPLLRSANKNTN